MADLPSTVNEYRSTYGQDYPDLKNVSDEQIALGIYNQGRKEGSIKDLSFDEFKTKFLPDNIENSADSYRKTYEKQFPELKKLTDAEIGNKVYDARVARGEKLSFNKFINTFAPREYSNEYNQNLVDPEGNIIGPDDKIKKQVRPDYTIAQIANTVGISLPDDVKDNANNFFGPKFAAAFGTGEKNKVLAYKNDLSKFYGQDVDVRIGPKTGEAEFLNPRTGKYTLVNQPGFDRGDLAGMAVDTATIIPQVIGNIAGFTFGGPGGAVAGGALAAGATEALRDTIGYYAFDINKDTNSLIEGAKTGAIVAPLEAIGVYSPKFVDWMKKWVSTGRTTVADVQGIVKDASVAKNLMDEVNSEFTKRNLNNKLTFTLGQAADDPHLLAIQNAFEKQPKYGFQGTYQAMNRENAEALNTYFGLINNSYGGKNFTPDQVGSKISQVMQNELNPERQTLKKLQQEAEADLTSATISLPNGIQKEAGKTIRTGIQELQNEQRKAFKNEYDALFEAGKNRVVKTDLIKDSIKDISEQQKNNLFLGNKDIEKIIKIPEGEEISLSTLKNTRTSLKNYDRQIRTGAVADTPEEGAVKKVLGSIDAQLKRDLKDDPWLTEYNSISNRYNLYKQRFDGVVGDLLRIDGNKLKLADEDVFGTSFKYGRGSQAKIDAVHDVVKEKPEALNAYRNSILDFYRDKVVTKEGLINEKEHEKFMKNYAYNLKTFFGEDNFNQISKIGELGKKVNEINALKDETLQKLKTTTAGRIEKLDPDSIFNQVYDPAKPTRLKEVVNILNKDPETLKSFQNVVTQDIKNGITDSKGDFDYNRFSNYLKTHGQNLETIFKNDPEYVKNLNKFNNILEILSRKNTDAITSQEKNALNDLIRARVGMFTLEGRIFSAAQKLLNYRLMSRMNSIITDPKSLESLLQLEKVPTKNYDLYNSIVYGLFGTQFSPETLQPEKTSIKKMEGVPSSIKFKEEPVKKINKPISQAPVSPNVNLFKANATTTTPVPVAATPSPQGQSPTAGLTNIPQDQLNKYSTLFGKVV
jgi:hypothetical protein